MPSLCSGFNISFMNEYVGLTASEMYCGQFPQLYLKEIEVGSFYRFIIKQSYGLFWISYRAKLIFKRLQLEMDWLMLRWNVQSSCSKSSLCAFKLFTIGWCFHLQLWLLLLQREAKFCYWHIKCSWIICFTFWSSDSIFMKSAIWPGLPEKLIFSKVSNICINQADKIYSLTMSVNRNLLKLTNKIYTL